MAESTEAKSYTLAEAASLTGLSVDALRKRILRGKVRANKSNEDGLWRVWLAAADIAASRESSQEVDSPLDMSSQNSALRAELAVVRESLARAEGEGGALRERLERAEGLADRAQQDRAAIQERLAVLEARLEAAQEAAAEQRERAASAEGEAKAVRERVAAAEAALEAYRREPWWRRMLWRP